MSRPLRSLPSSLKPPALSSPSPDPTLPAAPPPLTPTPPHVRIHPNLRSAVYCNAIAQGGEEEWNFAWEQFQKATVVNEADKLRAALACTKQVWLLDR